MPRFLHHELTSILYPVFFFFFSLLILIINLHEFNNSFISFHKSQQTKAFPTEVIYLTFNITEEKNITGMHYHVSIYKLINKNHQWIAKW